MTLLDVKHVQKIYKTRFQGNQVEALKDIHFTVEKGDYVAIMGESGSGKSTLLNILAMLDKPSRGKDNILLPLVLSRRPITEMMKKLVMTAENLGINQLQEKYPYEISGGQKQRVAVARAIITEPEILLADEPTGALDSKSSAALLDVFDEINERGQTILMVTHSTAAASRAKRVLFIKDGILYNQIYRGEKTERQMFQEISDTLTVMASEVN
ncbi:TPA: ABC transporter ATP-binding protein [Streptococcus pneumoniae]